ncbi:MAG: preprotein translocase subunit SecG [Candidatus Taylorbacteria bacterium RIFCSPLOWO2_12_FULL_43_20]|uniref:Protein-export membrane protein SecG n=1 Tax=Candidatus Taylorbacteria bacterium RIFCSPLOWO2_12_FULL_43_20 TaxID=1802332 RepID=A0A1G2P369_9BACT|nr:MAG: preprotein translocase subunit SecG [Candidatus Taylorbacteria bacterium RIFCSPHIGHO2_01_FULL_43_120]OHA23117.1 MAG: preprotein translocase subunit SecG [Candidatus Taylorbacteria bacterium RIFCSPHIGHO2_02_FULL_43_55]OHA28902.1 MAG: preprotein translocase subunit SecG [Candidatus Taylorbacteria bacterium RIFCSPHIGHO2_12_FULL_42_34]OHA30886.1 MAG: preprotein translocase subunit SecG [Candidatus Taylorbacteria bacterium RIFCSPLOWO2_01_FULL_43_83]OHA39320.1 MAG: preprotein translocase subu
MNTFSAVLPYIQIALSILLIIGILLQQSSAGLGGAFGEGNNFSGFNTKRGFERTLFIATIILAVLFGASAFIALII